MTDREERSLHCDLLRKKADELYAKAMDLIQRVDAGEFNEEKMMRVERVIAHCLAAIDDIELTLERELQPGE